MGSHLVCPLLNRERGPEASTDATEWHTQSTAPNEAGSELGGETGKAPPETPNEQHRTQISGQGDREIRPPSNNPELNMSSQGYETDEQNNWNISIGKDDEIRKEKAKFTKRTGTRVASLNIKGFGADLQTTALANINANHKWFHINQIMKEKKLAVLAVQESHLTEERQADIEKVFPRLKVWITSHPQRPTRKGGVALVINSTLINPESTSVKQIVAGRALEMTTRLHRGKEIRILAVYAPNDPGDNAEFWNILREQYTRTRTRLDMMIGDMNMVEDAFDRLPMHRDKLAQSNSMAELKTNLKLHDGWRETFPNKRSYTFTQTGGHVHSRIDRIYISKTLHETARNWQAEPSGIENADHDMISVLLVDAEAPETGRGRWSIPHYLSQDKIFMEIVRETGAKMMEDIEAAKPRTPVNNAQTIYQDWKTQVRNSARQRTLQLVPKLQKEITDLTKEIQNELDQPDDQTTPMIRGTKINDLKGRQRTAMERLHMKKRRNTKLKYSTVNETMTKTFAAMGKERKPRDIIYALRKGASPTNEPLYECDSQRMAEIARKYHDNLQKEGVENHVERETEREGMIQKMIALIDRKLTPEQHAEVNKKISAENLTNALKPAKRDSAAGLDGFTYEFVKAVEKQAAKDTQALEQWDPRGKDAQPPTPFSIVHAIEKVIRDIESFGIPAQGKFAEGWLCPIYKNKNERKEIANYRPITLLNADYKLYTKALALQLANVACSIITEEQAGFIPGRQISDQTQLIRMVMDWAEAKEVDGAIVALDQEKAYDKIAHDYLWKTLEAFNLPESFINAVSNLYANAPTRVCINGMMSEPYLVTRGVRQGDPLSCLLFDLAIEPLSLQLQKSRLKGLQVPGRDKRLIASLFADDTTVYLSKHDDITELEKLLDRWCLASRAKFNVAKTEVIPIGSESYRAELERTRRMRKEGPTIPETARIVPHGTPVRILGAWFGYGEGQKCPWSAIETKLDLAIERWSNTRVSTLGKRHVIQATFGGFTQYLTQVQGMPTNVRHSLERKIRIYLWGGGYSRVNADTAQAPHEVGGMKILDLAARNEAIDVIWLKRYLNISETRPLWAYFADNLFAHNTPTSEKTIPEDIRTNPFLQSWKPLTGHIKKIPATTKRLLKTAKKFNLHLINRNLTEHSAEEMPIWLHAKAEEGARRLIHGKASTCLIKVHQIKTVGETKRLAARNKDIRHNLPLDSCECKVCLTLESETDDACKHPALCLIKAEQLLESIPETWKGETTPTNHCITPEEESWTQILDEDVGPMNDPPMDSTSHAKRLKERQKVRDEWEIFDESLDGPKSINEHFRIFCEDRETEDYNILRPTADERPVIRIATDGSCYENGGAAAQAGAGGFDCEDSVWNFAIRVPSEFTQSNQTGEVKAIHETSEATDTEADLFIESDSKYAINATNKHRKRNEEKGYIGVSNRELIIDTVESLRQRRGATAFKWVKGHAGHTRNEGADRMANEGAMIELDPNIQPDEPPRRVLIGAKLCTMTQKLAYQGIREQKMTKYMARKNSVNVTTKVLEDIERNWDIRYKSEALWKSTKHRDITKTAQTFLWTALHDAFMIGNRWNREHFNEEQRARSKCKKCGVTEDMNHIMLDCRAITRVALWSAAKDIWNIRGMQWKEPTLGDTLGCGLTRKNTGERRSEGDNRLARIIMSETVRMIWVLRCERVIRENTQIRSGNKIRARWRLAINARIEQDCYLIKKGCPIKSNLTPELVIATWKDLIEKVNPAQDDKEETWLWKGGVLVGSEPQNLDDVPEGEIAEELAELGGEMEDENEGRREERDDDGTSEGEHEGIG